MKKAIILLSGGLDSAVCAALAGEQGWQLYTLCFDYGQRNKYEIKKARRISEMLGAVRHEELKLNLQQISVSSLTDASMELEQDDEKSVPATYVPARNMIFLSLAVSWAESIGGRSVFIGANVRDYSGYPDCRGDFLKAFEKAASLGTKKATKISIKAPLLLMTKERIIKEGLRLGLDLDSTSSCYAPGDKGEPCARCMSCKIRDKAFKKINKKKNE
ncbi:MAG: 7-cyano-7-deazaguanine synthase QueC [Elusimicrobiota bacterium]